MNLFLLLAGLYLVTFFFGRYLERIRVPWIFTSLLLGLILSFFPVLKETAQTSTFQFLAWLGMYFLLFLIGFRLDLKEIKKLEKYIFFGTFSIILSEALLGGTLIHFVFHQRWFLSFIISLSFATVGEAILIPILDEFKLLKTKLGQAIVGIGTLDDIIEVFLVILIIIVLPFFLPQQEITVQRNELFIIFFSLVLLFFLAFGALKIERSLILGRYEKMELIFLLLIALFFLFVGIGDLAEASALGALLAGFVIKNFLPKERIRFIEAEIRGLAYGFFGPIFFFWVGLTTNFVYLLKFPGLVLLLVLITYCAKVISAFLATKKLLGKKSSLLLGIALGARFSTSIVIIKFLFEKGLINESLYSVLIGSTAIFTFLVPILLAFLLKKFNLFGDDKQSIIK